MTVLSNLNLSGIENEHPKYHQTTTPFLFNIPVTHLFILVLFYTT